MCEQLTHPDKWPERDQRAICWLFATAVIEDMWDQDTYNVTHLGNIHPPYPGAPADAWLPLLNGINEWGEEFFAPLDWCDVWLTMCEDMIPARALRETVGETLMAIQEMHPVPGWLGLVIDAYDTQEMPP